MTPLVDVENLRVVFHGDRGRITHAVESVSFDLAPGVTLGLVGESGCGKSVTALAIMGLLPKGSAEVSGRVSFDGNNLLDLTDAAMRDLRGDRLAMIFQEPMTSLNPAYTIGEQIIETLVRHRGLARGQARARAIELLQDVRIPSPEQRVDEYPHKLSGGMRQRAMVAMALACDPQLLIADEPTTALDVTIQAQVLDLLRSLKAKTNAAIVLIRTTWGWSRRFATKLRLCMPVKSLNAGRLMRCLSPRNIPTQSGSWPPFLGLIAGWKLSRALKARSRT